jgi:hypothetical protein
LHDAEGFAIAFGFGLAKIADDALFGISSFLLADDGDGLPVEFSHTGNESFIVAKTAVAVKFDEIGNEEIDPVESVRALGVTSDLRALPGAEVGVELFAKFDDLVLEALEFRFTLFAAGEVAEIFDIFFQAIDFLLALSRGRRFPVFARYGHYATI